MCRAVGLEGHGGGTPHYNEVVEHIPPTGTKNNLTLNTDKTKEMIVDMRKERRPHQPLFIRDLEVERVSSFKYLGVHISDDLTWTLNTTYVLKRAQQRLYFLRRLRKFGMSPRILSNFYSCIIESILTSCITVWYGSTTVKDRKRLQRVVKTATKITKMAQPSLQSIYNLRVHRRAASIIKDPTHPQHGLFTLLPSAHFAQTPLYYRLLQFPKCTTTVVGKHGGSSQTAVHSSWLRLRGLWNLYIPRRLACWISKHGGRTPY
ncbi:hypothetical protein NFI96_000849 [Prochilodus magdalenae]|nr:hypothetical protein NFI96_000849 [Prochilodus magdalenae]